VITRLLAFILLCWALGFALFAVMLPKPAGNEITDGVVVVTGGPGRIPRGMEVIRRGQAKRMLISGVDRRVRPHELAAAYDIPDDWFRTYIDLGSQSVDTRSNAVESADWIERRGYRSVRLVTTDWHMRRARYDLAAMVGDTVRIVPDAVPSRPAFQLLLREYNKYLLRRIAALFGI